ncbi:MAG: hypothetical protein H6739_09260 [Alphaproteobacteria bacterium]|nr:hypothetical protein [Alphaproteobacteria bacterium]
MRQEDTFCHEVSCPLCAARYQVGTTTAAPPAEMPCGACWRTLRPADKAPWLRRMRAAPADRQALVHRDPVRYAPPTLQAYVENLERALAAAGG